MCTVPGLAPNFPTHGSKPFPKEVGSVSNLLAGPQTTDSFKVALGFSLNLPTFFEGGTCVDSDPRIFDGESLEAVLEAKKICSSCPIQAQCLEWASKTQDAGVWGGKTPQERKNLRGGKDPIEIGEMRELETRQARLLSDIPAAVLAAEFDVTERTIFRWRKKIYLNQKAS